MSVELGDEFYGTCYLDGALGGVRDVKAGPHETTVCIVHLTRWLLDTLYPQWNQGRSQVTRAEADRMTSA